jgi:glyceraldehyde-3-phosphate dehydrogenase/erythrose-4-phosphate dehydrogenase
MTRIALNGLGRIGRTFMKLALENPTLEIVAANDISDPDSLAYLIVTWMMGMHAQKANPLPVRGIASFIQALTNGIA